MIAALQRGEVVAYPTEAVFGLGCDPRQELAVRQVLRLKQRPEEKGLILIAAEIDQLDHWLDMDAVTEQWPHVLERWPGPVTWLLPCRPSTPRWLRGQFETLAVRVTAHPQAAQLCRDFGGALVSTSANPAGLEPARSPQAVADYFPDMVCAEGEVDVSAQPSTILDAQTQRVIRP
ncbi:Sua5/YciO/YrdC family protein [gamma proteobacterium HTCC5015]|nr:Sua5/YciO/YrdC family protein [gamma proteobacterium HTCC5015]